MPLTREERKLLHQKSKQPTFGINKPDAREGHEGDIAYRRVEGSGTVQYVKENGDLTGSAVSFTGGTIGGFALSTTQINSKNNKLILKSNSFLSFFSG